jgi:phospholipid/cholesterol/gamma-HCH transport system substrate-binding protein
MKLRIAILVTTFAVAVLLVAPRLLRHKFVVRAYFADAMNLRDEARVRLAGVDVGVVKSVRVRPEMKESPAEVVMVIDPGYELRIPDDSIVELETAGILGETFVEIDVSGTSGASIATNSVLKVRPTVQLTAGHAIAKLGEAINKHCDCDSKEGSSNAVRSEKDKLQTQTSKP